MSQAPKQHLGSFSSIKKEYILLVILLIYNLAMNTQLNPPMLSLGVDNIWYKYYAVTSNPIDSKRNQDFTILNLKWCIYYTELYIDCNLIIILIYI